MYTQAVRPMHHSALRPQCRAISRILARIFLGMTAPVHQSSNTNLLTCTSPRRSPSTGRPSPSLSTRRALGPRLSRLQPLLQRLSLRLALVVDVGINSNLITKVLDTSLADVDLVGALPATRDCGSRARNAARVLEDRVVGQKFVSSVAGSRERLDGCFVVAVAGGSPFLGAGNGAGESHT